MIGGLLVRAGDWVIDDGAESSARTPSPASPRRVDASRHVIPFDGIAISGRHPSRRPRPSFTFGDAFFFAIVASCSSVFALKSVRFVDTF